MKSHDSTGVCPCCDETPTLVLLRRTIKISGLAIIKPDPISNTLPLKGKLIKNCFVLQPSVVGTQAAPSTDAP